MLDLIEGKVFRVIHFVLIRHGLTADRSQQKHDIDAVAAIRIVAAAQSKHGFHFGDDTGFFFNFPHHGLLHGFIRLDKAARQLPIAAAMARSPAHEQKSTLTHHRAADADVVARVVARRDSHDA